MTKCTPTPRVNKILKIAEDIAISWGHEYVGVEHVLVAIEREKSSVAAAALANLGIKNGQCEQAIRDLIGDWIKENK